MPSPVVPENFEAGYIGRLDRRTRIGAEMNARWAAFTDDLGGADRLSYAQRSLAERALWLEYWLAWQEEALAEGRMADFDPGRWTQAANALQGILTKLGLERAQRDVTDLQSYIRGQANG